MFFDVYEVVAGVGGGGRGDDASVFVTKQVQISEAVILGKQFDGHNKSNYCLYQLYSRDSLLLSIKTLLGKKYGTTLLGKTQQAAVLDQFLTTFVSVNNKLLYQRQTHLSFLFKQTTFLARAKILI